MKKLLLIGFIALFVSCKKGESPIDTTVKSGLVASWEYRGHSCYCTPEDPNDIKPGNGNVVTYLADGTYKRFAKAVLAKSGTYKIVKDTNGGVEVNRIIYDNDATSWKSFFKIENNKLTIFGSVSAAADGLEEYYEKK